MAKIGKISLPYYKSKKKYMDFFAYSFYIIIFASRNKRTTNKD